MLESLFALAVGIVIGAVGFGLIIKNNPKIQKMFNLVSDKAEEILEEKLDTDL
jgi:divalent metal cation (Fe/Co/Zn/Cd) transporter